MKKETRSVKIIQRKIISIIEFPRERKGKKIADEEFKAWQQKEDFEKEKISCFSLPDA